MLGGGWADTYSKQHCVRRRRWACRIAPVDDVKPAAEPDCTAEPAQVAPPAAAELPPPAAAAAAAAAGPGGAHGQAKASVGKGCVAPAKKGGWGLAGRGGDVWRKRKLTVAMLVAAMLAAAGLFVVAATCTGSRHGQPAGCTSC